MSDTDINGLLNLLWLIPLWWFCAYGWVMLFQRKTSASDREVIATASKTSDAVKSFEAGKQIKSSQKMEAIKYFDRAIEMGLDESEVFLLRGSCLNDFGYYYEALEDYNRVIDKKPRKGIANIYFMRSQIKDSLCDFDGSISDLREAIRLSKLDNEDTRFWNNYAKSTGAGSSHTDFLEFNLETALRFRGRHTEEEIAEKLNKIQRRKTVA